MLPECSTARREYSLQVPIILSLTKPQICGAGVLACFVGETHNGVGMHTRFIKPDAFGRILHWQYFHSLIVTVGISLVKLSVGFFLLRLIPGKKQRIFLYCVIGEFGLVFLLWKGKITNVRD